MRLIARRLRLSLVMGEKVCLVVKTLFFSCLISLRGYSPSGPYAAIHVGAAAPTVPEALVDQLACPGSMFIPVGTSFQEMVEINKDEHGHVTKKRLMGVIVSRPFFFLNIC
jgi:hypothetical protein